MFAGTHIYCLCVLPFKNLYICQSIWFSRSLILFLQKNGIILSILLIALFSTTISCNFPFLYSSIPWFLKFAECFNILGEWKIIYFTIPSCWYSGCFSLFVIISRQICLHLWTQHSEDFSLCLCLSFLSPFSWILRRFLDQREIRFLISNIGSKIFLKKINIVSKFSQPFSLWNI